MLPGFLEGAYKGYKKDTSIFFRWLSETGDKCGYQSQSGKEKGNVQSKSGRILLPLRELVPLAQAIAKSEVIVPMPTAVLQTGIHAVALRKRFRDHFNTTATSVRAVRSTAGHSHFISLMEQILEILKPRFHTSLPDSKPLGTSSLTGILTDLEPQPSNLEVDESQQSVTEPSDKETDTSTAYDVEPPSDESGRREEKLFALFCLFDDLHDLRKAIQKAWITYLIGRSDIITASTITNTAFQLAIRTQGEFIAQYPDCGTYDLALETFLSMAPGIQAASDEFETEMGPEMAEWVFLPANQILDSFCDILNPDEVPMMKRGHFGVYNPNANRAKRSNKNNYEQDQILLIELLPEFAFLSRYKMILMAEDELTKGLRKMCIDKKISIWLPFATTALLDIHHLMKDKADRPFEDLQRVCKDAVGTLENYFEFSQTIPAPETWTKEIEMGLRNVCEGFKNTIAKDIIFIAKKASYRKLREPVPLSDVFYLYKRHPTLCGLLAYRIQLEMQYFGIHLCTAWGTVIHSAHLYQALKHNQSNQISPWPLMNRIIEIHSEERIFVGGKPDTIVDSFKQILLVLGYSAQNFSPKRRHMTPIVSKLGPRGLQNTSALSKIFRRGLSSDGSMDLTIHNIEELFKEQAEAADSASSTSKNKKELQKLRREWASTKRLSSMQLLEALAERLPAEFTLLQFNYFHMHQECIALLRKLKIELHDEFVKYIGEEYIDNESQLPFVVSYIIMIASGSKMAGQRILKVNDGESKILAKAGEVFEKFFREKEP